MSVFQIALAQHSPTCSPSCPAMGAFSPFYSLPLIVYAFILSLYSLWGVCVWGPGHSKHCSKSIALIKGITSQKREKKKHKLLWGVVWSLKKRDIQSKCLSHCKQQYHREAFRATTEKIIPAEIKERALRFHNLTSFLSVPCWWRIILFSGQPILTWPPNPPIGHSGRVRPISYPGKSIYACMYMCAGILYVLCMCMFVCLCICMPS